MLLRHPLNAVSLALISSFCTAAMADGLPNVHSKERIGTVQQVYDGALMPDVQANTFRNIDRLFSTRTIHKGKTVYPLPKSDVQLKNFSFASNGKNYDLYDYVSINRVSGLLVIKNGKIAFEDYELGNSDQTRWMSMSVVKSITATLVGYCHSRRVHQKHRRSGDPVPARTQGQCLRRCVGA